MVQNRESRIKPYNQLTFDNQAKNIQWAKNSLFKTGTEKAG